MIEASRLLSYVLCQLERIKIGQGIVIWPLKKDREVRVYKISNQAFIVEEDGFERCVFENLDQKELKKVLKLMQKREFPRSHQLSVKIVQEKP